MNKGLLVVISGPSGAGKGTICRSLTENAVDLELSVSATTRAPRVGEIEGKNYYFVSLDKFKEKIDNGEFLEYAKVYDNYYGTPKDKVIEKLNDGRTVILEIDIQGALQVKKSHPEGVFIFIVPPSIDELQKRIITRATDTIEIIGKRMQCVKDELNYVTEYDYVVMNDSLEDAVNKIRCIIDVEKMKSHRNMDLIKRISGEN